MPVVDVTSEIQNLFEKNKLEDLKHFMEKRKCLNSWNMVLIYLFHVVQSAGILTTTIAAGYDMKVIVWVGVGFNILASLINVFEKTNTGISKHRLFWRKSKRLQAEDSPKKSKYLLHLEIRFY